MVSEWDEYGNTIILNVGILIYIFLTSMVWVRCNDQDVFNFFLFESVLYTCEFPVHASVLM